MADRKRVDLYRRYRKLDRGKTSSSRRVRLLAAAAALLCVLAAWRALEFRNRGLEEELAGYWAWLDDPVNVAGYAEARAKEALAEALQRRTEAVRTLTACLAGYPRVDAELLERVIAAGGAEVRAAVRSYDSETGELVVQAESGRVLDASEYVEKLEELDVFQTVSHTGYVVEGGRYKLRLRCILRAAGGEEGQDAAGHIER